MTDLTDKWKKGELPEGFYYVKCGWSDEIEIRYVHNGVDDWKAIVTEVPSYDEWEQLENWARFTDDYHALKEKLEIAEYENAELKERNESLNNRDINLCRIANGIREENFALKELLKECSPYVSRSATSRMIKNSIGFKKDMKLLTKIDEALK